MPTSIRRRFAVTALLAAIAVASPGHAQAPALDVSITDLAGHAVQLSLADLQALPALAVTLAGEHGDTQQFTGPALWTVLEHGGAIDPNFNKRVRQTITATGRDGYSVVLAMGEIDPEFENKAVLLAIDLERKMLRLAIPGDKRLGRDVRDVASLVVREAPRGN